jgi:uncharacterized peroxidase-related enzyme
MPVHPNTGFFYYDESEAEGEIAELYAEIRRALQTPTVPHGFQFMSASPAAATAYWGLYSNFMSKTMLPEPLIAMILYAIAESNDCRFCSALNEATCRMYGIDDAILTALARDLGNVSPQRVQAIVRFALKVCHSPKEISIEDFNRLRDHGLSDEEIVEINLLAAIGQLNDILADSIKLEPDELFSNAPGVSAEPQ